MKGNISLFILLLVAMVAIAVGHDNKTKGGYAYLRGWINFYLLTKRFLKCVSRRSPKHYIRDRAKRVYDLYFCVFFFLFSFNFSIGPQSGTIKKKHIN